MIINMILTMVQGKHICIDYQMQMNIIIWLLLYQIVVVGLTNYLLQAIKIIMIILIYVNFSFLGSHDNAVKPKIRDNYIIAEQKGVFFLVKFFNLDEFTLQYSNFDVINNNKTDYIHRPGQKNR